jgi:hypothetical protein
LKGFHVLVQLLILTTITLGISSTEHTHADSATKFQVGGKKIKIIIMGKNADFNHILYLRNLQLLISLAGLFLNKLCYRKFTGIVYNKFLFVLLLLKREVINQIAI